MISSRSRAWCFTNDHVSFQTEAFGAGIVHPSHPADKILPLAANSKMTQGTEAPPYNQRYEAITMRWHSLSIVVLALSTAAGCSGALRLASPAIQGSGVAKEDTRAVDAFHAVEAGSSLQVAISVTPGAKPSLKLSGDDNLVPLVESEVRDGTLVLWIKDNSNIQTKLPLIASVVMGELDRLEASGAADVSVKGSTKADQFTADASGAARISIDLLDTPKATVSAEGASRVALAGSAASIKLDVSGASRVKAEGLKVEDADVSISGASSASLRASKSVTGTISGASQLDLHGRPAKNTVSKSGASSVNDKE